MATVGKANSTLVTSATNQPTTGGACALHKLQVSTCLSIGTGRHDMWRALYSAHPHDSAMACEGLRTGLTLMACQGLCVVLTLMTCEGLCALLTLMACEGLCAVLTLMAMP
jgi:hypothetical protein